MRMRVEGIRPKLEAGNCFRCDIRRWGPLATLVCAIAPSITRHCDYWFSKEGDGLNATDARRLAAVLDAAFSSGKVAMLIAMHVARLRRLPDVSCIWCNGARVRSAEMGRQLGEGKRIIENVAHARHTQTRLCNGCNGVGHTRPEEANYRICEADIRVFADFVKHSGGFRIC